MRKLTPLLALLLLASAPRGAEVHITFSGLICHVFDGIHAPRAVAMRGMGTMPHRATLHIPQQSIASSDVPLACSNGDCVFELADTAIRFPGNGRAHYTPGGSYDTIVPHLGKVTNGEMWALRDEVFDEVPSPASVISASIMLPAGTMSATPFDVKARFEPDFEHRGERQFAREVLLDGVIPRAELLVRRFGDTAWRSIRFVDDVELRVVNEPAPGAMLSHHERLFYDLAAQPLAVEPTIEQPANGVHASSDGSAACGNQGCCP